MIDSIIDSLLGDPDITEKVPSLPNRCSNCNNTLICSILPLFSSLDRIKIKIDVSECPYYVDIKCKI